MVEAVAYTAGVILVVMILAVVTVEAAVAAVVEVNSYITIRLLIFPLP